MANDRLGLRGNAGTPTTRHQQPFPRGPLGPNPANDDPAQQQVGGHENGPLHEAVHNGVLTQLLIGKRSALQLARVQGATNLQELEAELSQLEAEAIRRGLMP
jgi:hypothetical protein